MNNGGDIKSLVEDNHGPKQGKQEESQIIAVRTISFHWLAFTSKYWACGYIRLEGWYKNIV